ncbi:MAG: hypothetical protein ACKVZH_04825 [Blastocatellia bacterium]
MIGKLAACVALALSAQSFYDLILYLEKRPAPCRKDDLPNFFSLAAVFGLLLGWWAFRRTTYDWLQALAQHQKVTSYAGEWVAVLAMSVSVPALILTGESLPSFTPLRYALEHGRETAAIQTLRTIHNNQAQYAAMKDCFATLTELNQAGLIDSEYANGRPISGYRYHSSDVTNGTYCVSAYRTRPTCGGRDFIVCEDGDIRYVESANARALKRGEGRLLGEFTTEPPTPTPMP